MEEKGGRADDERRPGIRQPKWIQWKTIKQELRRFIADDAAAIRRTAGRCLGRVALDRRLRLPGVRVGTLSKTSIHDVPPARDARERSPPALTLPLFEEPTGTSSRAAPVKEL